MGGVCSGGTSTIRDVKETEFSGFPGTPSSTNRFIKQKETSSSRPGSQKVLQKYVAGESCKLRSSSPTEKGPSKVAEKSAFCEAALILSLKQAVKVMDTIGKSIPRSSKESVYGSILGGTKIAILAFEVANTIIKGEKLLQSLSENNIQSLKEALGSGGVQRLVSGDMEGLLMIAASDKRLEFDAFLREVIRFGDRCKDSQWHNLGRYFSKLDSGNSNPGHARETAEATMEELGLLARYTLELYHELITLDRFEQDYKQKIEEAELLNLPQTGDELVTLHDELKHQRKLVKSLKRKSLWSRTMEEVMVKFVDIATYIRRGFVEAFASSSDGAEKQSEAQRLGPAGLALHYANIIVQIDAIASRPACLPPNVRDALYHALPRGVKAALRSRLQAGGLKERSPISRVKTEMDKTLRWLLPLATNTVKAHQKFGWIGDWAKASKEPPKNTSASNESIRLQTLYHASKEKTELHILELVVWLHHLISLVKQRGHSIRPLPDWSPPCRKSPRFCPKVQQFPPMHFSILRQHPPRSAGVELSQEDVNLNLGEIGSRDKQELRINGFPEEGDGQDLSLEQERWKSTEMGDSGETRA